MNERDYTGLVWREDDVVVPHQRAMLEASKEGKRFELERLFQEHNVKKGDERVPYNKPLQTGAPPTGILFATAIRYGQRSILEFLQSIYSKVNLADSQVVDAFLENPDIAMLQLVYSQSPRICSFVFNSRGDTFLTRAFRGGQDYAPLIHFLLDRGELHDVHGCSTPLLQALRLQQPTEVIEKMVSKSPISHVLIHEAIRLGRADALRLIFTQNRISCEVVLNERLLGWVQLTKDKDTVDAVEAYIQQWKLRRAAKSNAEDTKVTRPDVDHLVQPTDEVQPTTSIEPKKTAELDSSGQSTETRGWWQFWKPRKGYHESDVGEVRSPKLAGKKDPDARSSVESL
jgi:hypothetical protein